MPGPVKLPLETNTMLPSCLGVCKRAFRNLKVVALKVRPLFHYRSRRVCAHVLLSMLVYYVEWHMRELLRPLLFDDDDPDVAPKRSAVAKAQVSPSAVRKTRCRRTPDGLPVHSLRTLLDDLAKVIRNRASPRAKYHHVPTPSEGGGMCRRRPRVACLGAVALHVYKPLSVDDMPGASTKEIRDAFLSPAITCPKTGEYAPISPQGSSPTHTIRGRPSLDGQGSKEWCPPLVAENCLAGVMELKPL